MPRGRPRKNKDITSKNITGKKISGKKITGKVIPENKVTGKKRGRPRKIISENNITQKDIPDNIKKQSEYMSREDMELRREKIRATLPKFNPDKVPNIVDLSKDKDICAEYTSFACHRPDIFLDYGCSQCRLQKHCACPIKDIKRIPDGRAPKIKKFVMKPKISS
jgi:hypothetical protein